MQRSRIVLIAVVVLLALVFNVLALSAQGPQPQRPQTLLGTAFTYQGQLKKNGVPVTDAACVMTFTLWNALSGGAQVGGSHVLSPVSVSNGLFTVVLNDAGQFGAGAFSGEGRWLEAAVQCAGDGAPVALSRQALSATPYALYAVGNWGLGGNTGTSAANFLGTADNVSLTLKVSNTVALRLVPNPNVPNLIGGFGGNQVGGGAYGATIGGGGSLAFPNVISGANAVYSTIGGGGGNVITGFAGWSVIGGGLFNSASGDFSTVGGGNGNTANAAQSTVGGGIANTATGGHSTVGGGLSNAASNADSTVGGGNNNTASGEFSTVGGGNSNTASTLRSTVGGGLSNTASGVGSTVSGGISNTASSGSSTVGGGLSNTASGIAGTVSGGRDNLAFGSYSFAAGHRAKANHEGAFVWADVSNFDFNSGASNQFAVRATGGISLVTNLSGAGTPTVRNISIADGSISFGADTRQLLNLYQQVYAIGVQPSTQYFRSGSGFAWFRNGVHSETQNDPGAGGTRLARLDSGGNLFITGTLTQNGADVAERIVTSDQPQPGDVVEIDPVQAGQFRLARSANSAAVAGVVSTHPGVRLNVVDDGSGDAGVQLALVGRVPVKVSAENGAIGPGDLLVASATPGHAMRAPVNPAAGTIIGKALGALDEGSGLIEMLVMLR